MLISNKNSELFSKIDLGQSEFMTVESATEFTTHSKGPMYKNRIKKCKNHVHNVRFQ